MPVTLGELEEGGSIAAAAVVVEADSVDAVVVVAFVVAAVRLQLVDEQQAAAIEAWYIVALVDWAIDSSVHWKPGYCRFSAPKGILVERGNA